MKYILYKASPAWGLPSYSAASVQVEVEYLQLYRQFANHACHRQRSIELCMIGNYPE